MAKKQIKVPEPPRGKYLFGTVKVGERGQIVIPKEARDMFDIPAGTALVVLGDTARGIALMKASEFEDMIDKAMSGKDSKK